MEGDLLYLLFPTFLFFFFFEGEEEGRVGWDGVGVKFHQIQIH